ncbi:DEAD/DEAH box helicase [Roseateles sp. BYS180W]|uniref:ATP-dependent RNA helicase RhlE n=1 Tax=Roseateles rivi TaxID=3299028 RepID=A0ABW7FSV5_9BURK
MSFDSLGLSQPLLRAIADAGYTSPTPIQAQAIPLVLQGGDLMAGAQTGTGKTAGFTLPMLQRLSTGAPVRDARGRLAVRALVLTPTRELAAQVEDNVRTYGKYLPLSSMVMFGGVGMKPQIDRLRKGVDILVATPGRLLDHVAQGTLDLSQIQILVLDEADRMLDMGFIHDIKKVLALLPKNKQSLLFSATFSDDIKALADRLLNQPGLIEVARRNATADTIDQLIHPVDRDKKKELLAHLIERHDWHQVLVFTRMKHGANRLAEFLNKNDITAMAIHGNKSQGARTKALADFKSGALKVLVATDIAARGIDIDQLPHVVNYELPNVSEDYVHRIGRTGRAGAQGQAVSLVCVDEEGFLRDIEKLIKREIPRQVIAGFEPDPNAKPEPIVMGRMVLHGGLGGGGAKRSAPGGGGGRGGPGRGAPGGPRQGEARSGHGGGRGGAPKPAGGRPAQGGRPQGSGAANGQAGSGRGPASGGRPANAGAGTGGNNGGNGGNGGQGGNGGRGGRSAQAGTGGSRLLQPKR